MTSLQLNALHFHQQPDFFQCCLVTVHTIPNKIILQFFSLGAGLNIRQKKVVLFSTFLVIVVVDREVHQIGIHGAEELSLMGILLVISQNLTCRLVADFQVLLIYLISDEEIKVLYALNLLDRGYPTIIF